MPRMGSPPGTMDAGSATSLPAHAGPLDLAQHMSYPTQYASPTWSSPSAQVTAGGKPRPPRVSPPEARGTAAEAQGLQERILAAVRWQMVEPPGLSGVVPPSPPAVLPGDAAAVSGVGGEGVASQGGQGRQRRRRARALLASHPLTDL